MSGDVDVYVDVMSCYVTLCYAMLSLCYAMLCYVMSCYVVLCRVMLQSYSYKNDMHAKLCL
jgi:hypothetical protein